MSLKSSLFFLSELKLYWKWKKSNGRHLIQQKKKRDLLRKNVRVSKRNLLQNRKERLISPYSAAFETETSKVEATFFLDQNSIRFHVRRKSQDVGNIKKVEIFHKKSGRQRSTELYPLTVFFVYWNNCTSLSGKNWTHFRKKVWEYQYEIQTFVEFLD